LALCFPGTRPRAWDRYTAPFVVCNLYQILVSTRIGPMDPGAQACRVDDREAVGCGRGDGR